MTEVFYILVVVLVVVTPLHAFFKTWRTVHQKVWRVGKLHNGDAINRNKEVRYWELAGKNLTSNMANLWCWWEQPEREIQRWLLMGMVEMIREADTGRLKSWGIVACRMWEKEEKPLRVENTQLRSKRKIRWCSVPEIKGGGHFKKEGVANSVKCCRMKLDEKASWLNHWEVNNDFNESGCSKCETLYGTGYK